MPTAIHRRVAALRAGADPTVIARLRSGWAVLGDPQVMPGYSLLLPDPVVSHLNELPGPRRAAFLEDMARLGDAVLEATGAQRINYAMFGNLEPALHAHVFPRRADEPQNLLTAHPWAWNWEAAPRFGPSHASLQARVRDLLNPVASDSISDPLDAAEPGVLDHIDLTVTDLGRSTRFYDLVLAPLGFEREADCAEGPLWRGSRFEVGLQESSLATPAAHDRRNPGLHHLAFAMSSRAAVDRMHEILCNAGVEILDPPADYPQYEPGYHAVFFTDPDGLKLECVYRSSMRPDRSSG